VLGAGAAKPNRPRPSVRVAEPVAAALHVRGDQAQPRADVTEEKSGRDLVGLPTRHQRIVTAVAFVNERPRCAGNLRVFLLHEPVAAVIGGPAFPDDGEHAVQPRRQLEPSAVLLALALVASACRGPVSPTAVETNSIPHLRSHNPLLSSQSSSS
jgi:hypothetical protein